MVIQTKSKDWEQGGRNPPGDMTRLTRLTNLLLQLQAKRVVTSRELADKFGISQRTVYRDIKALEEAGVPIIGETGTGYSLMDEYRLPPVMFTEHELNALLTAQQYFKNNSDKSISEDFDLVVTKVKAILRISAKAKTEKLSGRIKVFNAENNSFKTDYLSGIQAAIINANVLHIKYHTIYSGQISEREIEPLAVYYTKNNWVLIANCRLRNALREFRLDRIFHLKETGAQFGEANFSFEAYINSFSENS
jgi:predicted DNA-binding transcriptional regulator YafY